MPAEKARINKSKVHVDFMIGSPELDVDGITRDGQTVPVLRNGAWQISVRTEVAAPSGRAPPPASPRRYERGFRDFEQALAQLGGVLTEVVEPRERGEALEPEDALEERRRPVANRAALSRLRVRLR